MKFYKISICITTSVIILLSTVIGASEFEYKLRDGNRKEGIRNDVPSASLDLCIISFISYRENRKPSLNDYLKLTFYVPTEAPIFISVSELVPVHYYYMDPIKTQWSKGWQVFDGWAANAVLIPKEIHPSSLGVVARLNSNSSECEGGLLTPVLFYNKNHPVKVSSYELCVVSKDTLSTLSCQLKRWKADSLHSAFIVSEDPTDYIVSGTPITLRLNLLGEAPGWFELSLDAMIRDQIDGPKRTYYFFHQPTITQIQ